MMPKMIIVIAVILRFLTVIVKEWGNNFFSHIHTTDMLILLNSIGIHITCTYVRKRNKRLAPSKSFIISTSFVEPFFN